MSQCGSGVTCGRVCFCSCRHSGCGWLFRSGRLLRLQPQCELRSAVATLSWGSPGSLWGPAAVSGQSLALPLCPCPLALSRGRSVYSQYHSATRRFRLFPDKKKSTSFLFGVNWYSLKTCPACVQMHVVAGDPAGFCTHSAAVQPLFITTAWPVFPLYLDFDVVLESRYHT